MTFKSNYVPYFMGIIHCNLFSEIHIGWSGLCFYLQNLATLVRGEGRSCRLSMKQCFLTSDLAP
jgi:hypothetical protein